MGRWGVVLGAVLAVVALAVGGWWLLVGAPQARARAAADTAERYLEAWAERDWPALAARVTPPSRPALDAHRGMFDALEVAAAQFRPDPPVIDGSSATVAYHADLELAGIGAWSYDSELVLEYADRVWTVAWSPSAVHPALPEGGGFARLATWPERAPILARDGSVLVGSAPVVTVGVEPRRVTDPEPVVAALVDHAGAAEAEVRALLEREDLRPEWFYPVVELPRERFDEVEAALRPVPGIVFRSGQERTGPPGGLARHVLGRTGEATAEQLEELGGPYAEGDVVGQFGLERAMEQRLAGEPDLEVAVVDADGSVVEVLHRVDGVAPEPLRTTLDVRVQQAAEQALDGLGRPAALVAVDAGTGELRAVVNRPLGGFDRALAGRYPPGSTFKVVTTAALLGTGATADTVLDCPVSRVVGGRAFRNAGGLALGPISLREAFARSCNTAYVGAAVGLERELAEAARAFGFDGETPPLPLPSFGGSFPEPSDVTELAAAAIGQARVEASPAHMASVAAAAASGAWRAPSIIAGEAAEPRPVPGDAGTLQALMREVVASGTGTAAALPGEPVAGKTGSAEFGTRRPPETHAWFIGFRGDLAFAVLVEGGGAGGQVAAPIAARFLAALG